MRQWIRRLLALRAGLDSSPSETKIKINSILEERGATARSVLCNLGCGSRHHPDWINVDFLGDGQSVFTWDLCKGIPVPDHSCDAIYSSHAIEHFDRNGAKQFLKECMRALKPGRVLRLVAPDLEAIVLSYLSCLNAAKRDEAGAADKYEWAIIELLDQLVRHHSGGEMLKYWCQTDVPAEHFVAERVGTEYWRARAHCKNKLLGKRPLNVEAVGQFRLGGEVHQWMYDSYSLGRLLTECGFLNVRTCQANESSIEGFAQYHLDTESNGSIYKPDSFFIEASAP